MQKKWLTALFLLVVMTGSGPAGAPLHAGENDCPMAGMMDCCATAQKNSDKPEVRAAQLCCSLNCTVPGTTPTGIFKISAPPAVVLESVRVARISSPQSSGLARSLSPPGYRQNLNPAYIRHLALLI